MAGKPSGSKRVNGQAKRTGVEAEFPSPRYFQVHFEYLDSLLLDAAEALEVLKAEVAEVYRLMQADPVMSPDAIGRNEDPAAFASPIEPSMSRKRSKRAPGRQDAGCAVDR